jgi:NAD(P)-dependent dehydrogenase (short-subunit alcohol dehydrogenase family)
MNEVNFNHTQWALILGGSSGFGLATAKRLAAAGLSICIVHRDRRGAMERIERDFEIVRGNLQDGARFRALNLDALSPGGIETTLDAITEEAQQAGTHRPIRVMLHSIAFGNLKPIAPIPDGFSRRTEELMERLAGELDTSADRVREVAERLLSEGYDAVSPLVPPVYGETLIEDEDMARTIYSMGTSMLSWVQAIFARGLFAEDARVFGLTSEGNDIAWRGYAAVSAAKTALESVSRSIAVEFAPYGIRSNIVQAGVTDTPALRAIPGSNSMKAAARSRNPFGRLTTPEDVANVVYLLSRDEAAWINGSLIRADGGEHVASS